VRSLYPALPPAKGLRAAIRWARPLLPSYIPAQKFVIALLDNAAPSAVRAPPPLPPDPQTLISGGPPAPAQPDGPKASPPLPDGVAAAADPTGEAAEAVPPAVAPGTPPAIDWPAKIGEELDAIVDKELKTALCSLWNAASFNVIGFRAGVEEWFNHTMDRASGWYRVQTQVILLVFGLAIAIGLNVDTVRVTQRLWSDGALRAAVAEEVKKLPPPPPPTTVASSPPDAGQLGNQVDQIQKDLGRVNALRLPLGWSNGATPRGGFQYLRALLGWVITAIALSLGAPFWFDLLSKVAALRGTGTKETTPAQEPKAKK